MRTTLLSIFLLTIIFLTQHGYAQSQDVTDDTITVEESEPRLLDEITVVGYDDNRKLLETPGAVGLVDRELINAYSETSVVPAMNTIPGVRMEQRAPGSYRIAIRGSTLRAPYGVRNVKVYWNGIPFTGPAGGTDFNLLDIININRIEVIKGPAGSIYGAGTGGVVNLNSDAEGTELNSVGVSFGSFGMRRADVSLNKYNGENKLTFKYAHQQSDGYRANAFLNRDVLQLSGSTAFSDKSTLGADMLYSDLYYGIPGGLNREEFENDPSQARPNAVSQQAGIRQRYMLIGVSHDYQWNGSLSNQTVIYGNLSFFENPYLFDYKRETHIGGGGRTRFQYDTQIGSIGTSIIAGAEYQNALNSSRNFGNSGGQPVGLNFDDELRSWQAILFAKANLTLPNDFFLTLGLSRNMLDYDIFRVAEAGADSSYRVSKNFDPVWTPQIGLVRQFGTTAVHGSISYGFSPPTIEDVRTNEGSINLNLNSEKGINYEVGYRGNVYNKLNFDVTAFYFKLDETIVQQQSDRGTVLFVNAGSTDQRGLETSLNYFAISRADQFLSDLEINTSYTLHRFIFRNYIKQGEEDPQDFSNNMLTGVAPNIWVTTALFKFRPGFYLNLAHNFTDEIPLNDANTVYSDAYHLVQSKIGYKKSFDERLKLELYAGVDNLLNQTYSLGNDLNAFGNRYYQPAAPRNYYGGVKMYF